MFEFLSHFAGDTVGSALLLSLAVVVCAMFLEDVTIIVVGMLAADGFISIPVAFASLYLGIVLGDISFYFLGRLARMHPRLARYIDHDFTAPFRSWLGNRYACNVFSVHFVPGLRSTSYLASGFFRYPFSVFLPMAMAGGLLLGTALFSLSYWFGSLTSSWIIHARWGIALAFLLILLFVARHNLMSYRMEKDAPSV